MRRRETVDSQCIDTFGQSARGWRRSWVCRLSHAGLAGHSNNEMRRVGSPPLRALKEAEIRGYRLAVLLVSIGVFYGCGAVMERRPLGGFSIGNARGG